MPKSRQRWLGLVEAKNGTKPNDESGFVDDDIHVLSRDEDHVGNSGDETACDPCEDHDDQDEPWSAGVRSLRNTPGGKNRE